MATSASCRRAGGQHHRGRKRWKPKDAQDAYEKGLDNVSDEKWDAGPEIYFYSAIGHYNQRDVGVAEDHARRAADLDVDHGNPKSITSWD